MSRATTRACDTALQCAIESKMKARVGCCIVMHGNRAPIRGTNHRVGNTKTVSPAYHAEMHAIEQLFHRFGLTSRAHSIIARLRNPRTCARMRFERFPRICEVCIYVARVRRDNGMPDNARPCEECNRWITACDILGIKVKCVCHTDGRGNFVEYDGVPFVYRGRGFMF